MNYNYYRKQKNILYHVFELQNFFIYFIYKITFLQFFYKHFNFSYFAKYG